MLTETEISTSTRHSRSTRYFHGALATAICVQLLTSLVMQGPRRQEPGDWLFQIHQYSGLVALVLAMLFFCHVMTRTSGTDRRALLPWFNAPRRAAVADDLRNHWQQLRQRRLPLYSVNSAMASAVHGLGLLLMLGMATTGAVFFIGLYLEKQNTGLFSLDIQIHKLLANLVWAYLVGHAGLAVLHHVFQKISLREMWSFKR